MTASCIGNHNAISVIFLFHIVKICCTPIDTRYGNTQRQLDVASKIAALSRTLGFTNKGDVFGRSLGNSRVFFFRTCSVGCGNSKFCVDLEETSLGSCLVTRATSTSFATLDAKVSISVGSGG